MDVNNTCQIDNMQRSVLIGRGPPVPGEGIREPHHRIVFETTLLFFFFFDRLKLPFN